MNGHASADYGDHQSYGSTHMARGVGRLTEHSFLEGKGSYITTTKGETFLDLTCGIGVTNLGHCHPKITEATQKQCAQLVHAQVNIGYNARYIELLKKLIPKLPHPSLDTVFLWNSGSEAVEASIKLARAVTKKQNVIVMQGSYHGRTFATMGMTRSKTVYGEGFLPHMPGVFSTAFPYYSQFGVPSTTPESQLVEQCLHRLRLLLKQETAPSDTAAIILEPVLGEGGYVPAPKAFLEGLRKICDDHSMLLIADEVQSGMGRTGTYWSIEQSGVRPDILVFAKGIANGFPLSGIASRKELMDLQKPGSMGGTYAGNAVSCAAACAVIDVIEEEKILENVAARSKQLLDSLAKIQQTKAGSLIEVVRGQGLMIGVQFKQYAEEGAPQLAPKIVAECIKRGMLLLSTSVFDCLRFIPALNISEEDMSKACKIFEEALNEVAKQVGKA